VKYWEIIADNLKKAGSSLGYVSAIDSEGRPIWLRLSYRLLAISLPRTHGRGGGVGRGLGVGVDLGGIVGDGGGDVAVAVAVAVAVGVGVTQLEPSVPLTPMEKSAARPWKLESEKLLLKNAFMSLPHGVPTQLVPLVSESNERPVRSPIGVTLSQ
jgi:hypothetical protein